MSLEEVKMQVQSHDRSLEMVATAIEDLAAAAGATNMKLDKVVEAMGVQNVIVERLNNMDKNLIDSFKRRDDRLEHLETVQSTSGCGPLKVSDENMRSLGRSVDTLRAAVDKGLTKGEERTNAIERRMNTFVSGIVIRWAIGIMVTLMIISNAIDRSSDLDANDERSRIWDRVNDISAHAMAKDLVSDQMQAATDGRIMEMRKNLDKVQEDLLEIKLQLKGKE